jgi:hypothetical protein
METRIPDMTADDLRKLNSATQYPSIPTYHALGERGRLTETRNVMFDDVDTDQVEVTEKIDGTNARIILPPLDLGAPLIGSRTELLTYVGDVIVNPAQGIVDAVRLIADRITQRSLYEPDELVVLFGEVYGGKVGSAWKNYGGANSGFRIFDVARIPLDVLDWPIERIAGWRDLHRGQAFVRTDVLAQAAETIDEPIVPLLTDVKPPPAAVADTHQWLTAALASTHAALDDTAKGKPEGVVVRTADRGRIAKIRFEDYERTAKAGRR